MDEKYPLALPERTILAGQYMIEKVLGQGGFGITYRATDHKTGQKVAVKEFFPDTLAYREVTTVISYPGERSESYEYGKESFLQEAQTLAEFIGNENIVRIHSYFEENGTAYFVMDYIEGKSFDDYIKEKGGKVSVEEAKRILIPMMDALNLVHSKGIVHRDVTPDNIYITNDGTVKLLDFGAARYSLGDKSRSLDVILKHGFAPKEQYTRRGKQGPFTDIYSLGATFYFAITGKRPPDSVDRLDEDDLIPPSNLGVDITEYQESAILQALSVQPADRFQTMADFKRVLLNESTATNQIFFTAQETVAAPTANQTTAPVQQGYPTTQQSDPGARNGDSAALHESPIKQKAESLLQKLKQMKHKKLVAGIACALVVVFFIGYAVSGSKADKEVDTASSGSVNEEDNSQSSTEYDSDKEDDSQSSDVDDNDDDTTSTSETTAAESIETETSKAETKEAESAEVAEETETHQPTAYDVSELCIVGTTAGNIKNCGLYTYLDENYAWIGDGLHSLYFNKSCIYENYEGEFKCLSYYDEILYFLYDGKAYMRNMSDGSGEKRIPELVSYGDIESLYVTTGCYFIYTDKKLYRISRKIGEEEEWIDVSDYMDIDFDSNGWLYYVGVDPDGFSTLYRVAANNYSNYSRIIWAKSDDVYLTEPVISGNYLYVMVHGGSSTYIIRYIIGSYEQDFIWDISDYAHESGSKGGSNVNHAYSLNVMDDNIFFTTFDAGSGSYTLYGKSKADNEFELLRDNAIFPCIAKKGTNYDVYYLGYNEEEGTWPLKYREY